MTERPDLSPSLESTPDDWELVEASEMNLLVGATITEKSDTRDDLIKGTYFVTTVENKEKVSEELSGVKTEIQEGEKMINPSSSDIPLPESKQRCHQLHDSSSIDNEGSIPSSRSLLRDRTRSCATVAEEIFTRQFKDDEDGQFVSFSSTFHTESNADKPYDDENEDFIPYGWTFGISPFGSNYDNNYSADCKEVIRCLGICCWDFIFYMLQQTDTVNKWLLLISAASLTMWFATWISYRPQEANTCSVVNIVVKGARITQILLFGVGPPLLILEMLLRLRLFAPTVIKPVWSETMEKENPEENNNNDNNNSKDGMQNQPETSSRIGKTDITMLQSCFFYPRESNENNEDGPNEEGGIHIKNSSELVIRLGSVTLLCISVGAITQSVIIYCS
ncbi:hypothetical protein LSM04_004956 [Trypanosoma melophagium]|uniref:uncharacterized protein n=1 Tax=Trypanosoma melophagium TaxID=715481 RepID=UPI00351A86FB|nr:hypothetical protein LSM04_004956 [Trypanosoma melophagium]